MEKLGAETASPTPSLFGLMCIQCWHTHFGWHVFKMDLAPVAAVKPSTAEASAVAIEVRDPDLQLHIQGRLVGTADRPSFGSDMLRRKQSSSDVSPARNGRPQDSRHRTVRTFEVLHLGIPVPGGGSDRELPWGGCGS